MNISTSQFSAGLSAIQNGQQQMAEAAQNIAQSTTKAVTAADPTIDISSITEQLMQLEQAKIMSQLGAKVVSSAEESLGTLIDIQS